MPNQYTSTKAQNIAYTCNILRYFLDQEKAKEKADVPFKLIVTACRLLFAAEGVHMFFAEPTFKKKQKQKIEDLGQKYKSGTIELPDLLEAISKVNDANEDKEDE